MSQQWLRYGKLTIGTASGTILDLSNMEYKFTTTAKVISTLASIDIRVYNLQAETVHQILEEGLQLKLIAGYETGNNYGQIFSGQIIQVRVGKERGTDTFIDISATDGDALYNQGFISITQARGSSPYSRLALIVANTSANVNGVNLQPDGLKYYNSNNPTNVLPRGRVYHGLMRDHLRPAAAQCGADWNISDNSVNILGVNDVVPTNQIAVINAESGMIGLPQQTVDGIHVKCLLNPNIIHGQKIQLKNGSIQQMKIGLSISEQAQYVLTSSPLNEEGLYKVIALSHEGDIRGGNSSPWYTNIICQSITAGLLGSQVKYQPPTSIPQ